MGEKENPKELIEVAMKVAEIILNYRPHEQNAIIAEATRRVKEFRLNDFKETSEKRNYLEESLKEFDSIVK